MNAASRVPSLETIDHELDLAAFYQHYSNDDNGRPAYDPRLLLKIGILAYSKGTSSNRRIETERKTAGIRLQFITHAMRSNPHESSR